MINETKLKYDATIEEWKDNLRNGLEEHGVIYNDNMLNNMCSSLSRVLINYLTSMGYRPKANYSYRKGLASRLDKEGLEVSIKTNRIMWKYLEYFTDVVEYDICFDVEIKICDLEKAVKDMIFIGVNTDNPKGIVRHPKFSEEYASITSKLDLLKMLISRQSDPDVMVELTTQILEILELIVRRLD